MCELFIKTNKILNRIILVVYLLNVAVGVNYIYVALSQPARGHGKDFFVVYYSVTCGIKLAIDLFLINCLLRNRNIHTGMILLLIYSAVQILTVFVDISCNIICGGLWNTGFAYIILELATSVIYFGRYLFLKNLTIMS